MKTSVIHINGLGTPQEQSIWPGSISSQYHEKHSSLHPPKSFNIYTQATNLQVRHQHSRTATESKGIQWACLQGTYTGFIFNMTIHTLPTLSSATRMSLPGLCVQRICLPETPCLQLRWLMSLQPPRRCMGKSEGTNSPGWLISNMAPTYKSLFEIRFDS